MLTYLITYFMDAWEYMQHFLAFCIITKLHKPQETDTRFINSNLIFRMSVMPYYITYLLVGWHAYLLYGRIGMYAASCTPSVVNTNLIFLMSVMPYYTAYLWGDKLTHSLTIWTDGNVCSILLSFCNVTILHKPQETDTRFINSSQIFLIPVIPLYYSLIG